MRYSADQLRDFALREYWEGLPHEAQRTLRDHAQRCLTLAEEMGAFWAVTAPTAAELPAPTPLATPSMGTAELLGAALVDFTNTILPRAMHPGSVQYVAASVVQGIARVLAAAGWELHRADGAGEVVALRQLAEQIDVPR